MPRHSGKEVRPRTPRRWVNEETNREGRKDRKGLSQRLNRIRLPASKGLWLDKGPSEIAEDCLAIYFLFSRLEDHSQIKIFNIKSLRDKRALWVLKKSVS